MSKWRCDKVSHSYYNVTRLQSVKVTKWQGDKVSKCQSVKVSKWKSDKVTRWQSDKVTKCQSDNLSHSDYNMTRLQVSKWQSDKRIKWKGNKMTKVKKCNSDKVTKWRCDNLSHCEYNVTRLHSVKVTMYCNKVTMWLNGKVTKCRIVTTIWQGWAPRSFLFRSKKRTLHSFPFFSWVFGDLWDPKESYVLL